MSKSKRRLSFEEWEDRIVKVEGFLIALAALTNQDDESFTKTELREAANAIAKTGREVINELACDIAERLKAR